MVETLLEKIGCDDINFKDNRVEARRPNGNNKRGIAVYLDEGLHCKIWTKGHLPSMDIYGLVSYIVHKKETEESIRKDLNNAKTYIINELGLTQFSGNHYTQTEKVEDPLSWLKDMDEEEKAKKPNTLLDENIMNQFVLLPHRKWIDEGLSFDVLQQHKIGFCMKNNRITIPIRDEKGRLVSIKGRRVIKRSEHDPKYLYLYSVNKSLVLYNYHRAIEAAKEKRRIIVFESEKSTMFAEQYGVCETVAIGGSDLSNKQIDLLKDIGLDCKIIVMMDKDKSKEDVYKLCKKITNRDVYAMWDTNNLLGDPANKLSPVDLGEGTFKSLLENNVYKIKK